MLLTLVVAFQQHRRVTKKLQDPAGGHVSDFDRWMLMTPAFLNDRADYVNDEMPTPPLTLIGFAPFTWISRPNATFLWVCAKLLVAAAVVWLVTAVVARSGTRLTPSALALIIVVWSLMVVSDMQEGQMNFAQLLPLVGGLYLAQRDTPASDLAAGALIALAIAVKVTPVVFVAYFFWRRRWRIVSAATVSLTAWWLVVPSLFFGWQQNITWFTQWARIMLLPYITEGKIVYATSMSVPSFALRLLSPSPAFHTRHDGVLEAHYMNVMSLNPDTVHQVVRLLMIAVGLTGLWWMRGPLRSFRTPRYVLEIGAVSCFMVWFSERSWVHHYISIILMFGAAGMLLSDPARSTDSKRRVRWALWAFFFLCLLSTEVGQIFGPDGIDWARALGAYLLPSILVSAVVLRESRDTRELHSNRVGV